LSKLHVLNIRDIDFNYSQIYEVVWNQGCWYKENIVER